MSATLHLYEVQIVFPAHDMKSGFGICLPECFRHCRSLISPFELQCRQTVRTLLYKIYFLPVVCTPKIKLLMQTFIEICLAPFPYYVVLPQRTHILTYGKGRKRPDNGIADAVIVKIPFPGFRYFFAEITRKCAQTIYHKHLFQQVQIFFDGNLAHAELFAQLIIGNLASQLKRQETQQVTHLAEIFQSVDRQLLFTLTKFT